MDTEQLIQIFAPFLVNTFVFYIVLLIDLKYLEGFNLKKRNIIILSVVIRLVILGLYFINYVVVGMTDFILIWIMGVFGALLNEKNGEKECVLHYKIRHNIKYKSVNTYKAIFDLQECNLFKEDRFIYSFIIRELRKLKHNKKRVLISKRNRNRRIIVYILFSILLFVTLSSIFFHLDWYYYLLEVILVLIVFSLRRLNNYKFYINEIKNRPKDKLSTIILDCNDVLVKDHTKIVLIIGVLLSIVIPLILFNKPRMIFNKVDNHYELSYYILGLTDNEKVEVPDKYDDENVTSIGAKAFRNDFLVQEITLPKGINTIGAEAFANCTNLKKINLPDDLNGIKRSTFESCKSLTSITIPDSVYKIESNAFKNDENLSEFIFDSKTNISYIDHFAFNGCSSLKAIDVPLDLDISSEYGAGFHNADIKINRFIGSKEETITGDYKYSTTSQTVKDIEENSIIKYSTSKVIVYYHDLDKDDNTAKLKIYIDGKEYKVSYSLEDGKAEYLPIDDYVISLKGNKEMVTVGVNSMDKTNSKYKYTFNFPQTDDEIIVRSTEKKFTIKVEEIRQTEDGKHEVDITVGDPINEKITLNELSEKEINEDLKIKLALVSGNNRSITIYLN